MYLLQLYEHLLLRCVLKTKEQKGVETKSIGEKRKDPLHISTP